MDLASADKLISFYASDDILCHTLLFYSKNDSYHYLMCWYTLPIGNNNLNFNTQVLQTLATILLANIGPIQPQ